LDLGRGVARFAALIAIALQVLIVQTHVEPLAAPTASAGIERTADNTTATAQHGAHAACVICQTQAMSGRHVLAAGVAAVSADHTSLRAAPPKIRRVPSRPAHAWQSRAPPLVL
jgi:hypothetical protein